ncbi:MAG: serine/threonine protein kinase [Anaerolineae bacterium]|nr:serine/threonine protein kinase [Anaerolineae bacterium]
MYFELTPDEAMQLVPNATIVGPYIDGGQKIVYPCLINNRKEALKFLSLKPDEPSFNQEEYEDMVTARATREVDTLEKCKSPHLVRIGSVALGRGEINEKMVLYYSEEWIEGEQLQEKIAKKGPLSPPKVVKLALAVTEAVEELWQLEKVHRDIKPKNIMHRYKDDDFVLLDIGVAFDIHETSITEPPFLIGTAPYFSPEQFDYGFRRQLDFRSDFFALGTVLYLASTGVHPFYLANMTNAEIYERITKYKPSPPKEINATIPEELSDVIIHLLQKKPHLRPRTFDLLRDRLRVVPIT